MTTLTQRKISKSMKAGFLPVAPEVLTFVMHALLPEVADREAQQVLAADDLQRWREGDQGWRSEVIQAALARCGPSASSVMFFVELSCELRQRYQAVEAMRGDHG